MPRVRGGGKEGQFRLVQCWLSHSIQEWDNDYWSNEVIELRPSFIKNRYPPKAWIVLHGWPIALMAQRIRWVSSSWNIGMAWSSIADCPTIGPDCECCRCIGQALEMQASNNSGVCDSLVFGRSLNCHPRAHSIESSVRNISASLALLAINEDATVCYRDKTQTVRKKTGHLPISAKTKKMKKQALHTHNIFPNYFKGLRM